MNIDIKAIKQSLQLASNIASLKAATLHSITCSRDNIVFLDNNHTCVIKVFLTKSLHDVIEETKLLNFLRENEFPTAAIIDNGSISTDTGVYPFVVFDYVAHDAIDQKLMHTEIEVEKATNKLALLHKVTSTFPKRYVQERKLQTDINKLLKRIQTNTPHAANTTELVHDLEWALAFLKQFTGQDCIIHNDFRVNNILFNHNEVAAVIDFEWAISSPSRLKDVGHAALEWSCVDGAKIDWHKYWMFISAYEAASCTKLNQRSVNYWSMFSALADAAYYFLSYPERTENQFDSYMYDKFKQIRQYVG